jgi:hypothetical protein
MLMMSGEDLCNTGPIALLQDLAVMAALGIESVERNRTSLPCRAVSISGAGANVGVALTRGSLPSLSGEMANAASGGRTVEFAFD